MAWLDHYPPQRQPGNKGIWGSPLSKLRGGTVPTVPKRERPDHLLQGGVRLKKNSCNRSPGPLSTPTSKVSANFEIVMVLDPFSALSLAGNIVQFVDFASKLFSKSKELYKSSSGATKENQEIEDATDTLRRLCASLKKVDQVGSKSAGRLNDEDVLRELANNCHVTANELLSTLEDLRIRGPHAKWQSFRQALRTAWKEEKIVAMENKLASYRSQLTLQLSAMQDGRQSSILTTLRNLSDANRQLGTDMASNIANLRNDILTSLQQLEHSVSQSGVEKHTTGFWNLANKGSKRERVDEKVDEKIDVVALSKWLSSLVGTGNDIATAQKILKSLRFSTMEVRHSKIAGAHPNTFRWMFEKPTNPRLQVKYVEWLRSNDPIYWISGKPGSGKSTLMKYLVSEERTRAHLQSWAGPKTLVIASFFFWITGTEMQKSQEGLLQSLLYEVLKQCPSLIPSTFPSRWQMPDPYHENPDPWTRSELLEAFGRLKEYDLSSTRFCFFIDGLDEYEGDHTELIDVIRGLIDSANVKICLSSRPWNVFEAAFGSDPIRKLYLQDLNETDIKLYVKDKLQDRDDFIKLMQRDNRCSELVAEIVGKAKGVFLWVYLVVRSLVEGLNNCDRTIDLQRRLREFPEDLEEYFKHILTSLDRIYREQTARAFQTSLRAARPLSLLNYWFLDMDEEDTNFALNMEIQPLSIDEIHSRHAEMKSRLNGRCKGLLEVCADMELDLPFQYHVDFLHRTVRDFLLTKDMQELLADWTAASFDANLAICRTILAEIKSLRLKPGYLHNSGSLLNLVEDFMYHAREVEVGTNSSPVALLDALETVIDHFAEEHPTLELKAGISYPWEFWVIERNYDWQEYNSLLTFAIEKNLLLYVQRKLDHNLDLLLKKRGRPLLDYAMRPESRLVHSKAPNIPMAGLLLGHGANPNERWAGATVWKHYITMWCANLNRWPQNVRYESIKMLILHGADRDIKVKVDDSFISALSLKEPLEDAEPAERAEEDEGNAKVNLQVSVLFSRVFSPDDAAELRDIMYPRGRSRLANWIGWR